MEIKIKANRKQVLTTIALLTIAVVCSSLVTDAIAVSINNRFVINSGVYPAGTAFTIYQEGSISKAKNAYGDNKYISTDTSVTMQGCFNALPDGGSVFIKDGNYTFNSQVRCVSDKPVNVKGESRSNTVLIKNFNGESLLYYEKDNFSLSSQNFMRYLTVSDLTISGYKSGSTTDYTNGIWATGYAIEAKYVGYSTFENLYITQFEGLSINDGGIRIGNDVSGLGYDDYNSGDWNTIQDCVINYIAGYPILGIYQNELNINRVLWAGKSGYSVYLEDCIRSHVVRCEAAVTNLNATAKHRNCFDIEITDFKTEQMVALTSIFIGSYNGSKVWTSGVNIDKGIFFDGTSPIPDIKIDYVTGARITNADMKNNLLPIVIGSHCSDTVIQNNYFWTGTVITNDGVRTKFENNINYLTYEQVYTSTFDAHTAGLQVVNGEYHTAIAPTQKDLQAIICNASSYSNFWGYVAKVGIIADGGFTIVVNVVNPASESSAPAVLAVWINVEDQ